jgi:putative ABC transport system permease protein
MLIERDAVSVARAGIGDTVTLRTDHGQLQTLRIGGRVHDVGQAQARMENAVYGYITPDTLAGIGEKPVLNLLLIQTAQDQHNPDHVRKVALDLKRRLQAQGFHIGDIDVPAGKHPHADLMAGLLVAISSFGFFLLVLSGVLALNFIAALMARQIRLIGVMKALGARRFQIARIYLVQSLLLGSVATALALPLGIWGSHKLCSLMAGFLNFDITSFSIPAWVFLSAAAAGLAVPLLASAIPVWRAVAMPVRRALANAGTAAQGFGEGSIDRALAGMSGGTRPVLFAVRNSFRKRLRLLLTGLTLVCAAALFMTALDLRATMMGTFVREFAAERYDLTIYLEEMYPKSQIQHALGSVSGVLASENWIAADGWVAPPVSNMVSSSPSNSGAEEKSEEKLENRFSVIGLPAGSSIFAPVMAQGRGLRAGDTDAVVLNPMMAAQNPGMHVGDDVRLHISSRDRSLRVVGICREPMQPPAVVYVPMSLFDPIHSGMSNVIQIALEDARDASLERAREQIDPSLERDGIRVSGARSKSEFRSAVDEHVLMIYVFLVIASCVVGGVGGLGMMTTMGINVLERRREIGILRVIGATPIMVCTIFIGEAITITILAWLVALVLAYPLTRLLAALIGRLLHGGFDFRIAPLGIVGALGALLATGILASVFAALSSVRLSIREALTYE